LHNFLVSQPDLNLHSVAVQDEILAVARFWLDRGVDGFRLDVANFYTHDLMLRDNPPAGGAGAVKPYDMQLHVYDRSRPETLPFLARLRGVLDEYEGRMAVAELFTSQPVARTAEYTAGPDRLHTAYNFALLGGELTAARVRRVVEGLAHAAPGAWPSWAFENHDVKRSISRWGAGRPAYFARTLIALLTTLRGTPFLYQGQELGLPQAELPFAALRDPDGIAFWPDYKGRDGCRTPMPWGDGPGGGFTTGVPWLPVPEGHVELSVDAQAADPESLLCWVRGFLAWRRGQAALVRGDIEFFDLAAPVLAFTRGEGAGRMNCVFNLGLEEVRVPWRGAPPDLAWPIGAVWREQQLVLPGGAGVVFGGEWPGDW
jgi:alpha-glucosidase